MKRVYVAGAYSSPNVIGVFTNMRRGCRLAYEVLSAGYAPFTPWLDWLLSMFGFVSLADYQAYSMAFLEACDAVLVQPVGCEASFGTQAELARAKELGIPIFYTIEDLEEHFKTKGEHEQSRTTDTA